MIILLMIKFQELFELGYNKYYVKECIFKNEINYATASYYLLDKYFDE